MALQYSFYKEFINLTFILAFSLRADFSDEPFLPISFAMPLKRATEAGACLSGFV